MSAGVIASHYVATGVSSATPWNPNTMLGGDQLHPNDTGMTVLADNFVAALAAAGKTPSAGAALTAYGDSYTALDVANTAGMRAIIQLRDRLGLTLTNRAVSGYKIGDCAATAIGVTGTFVPGTGGLAFVEAGINDLLMTDDTQTRAAMAHYLRSLFAVLCAAERIEETAFSYSGTWITNPSIQGASGGSNKGTSQDGASATYTITTPGTYYLLSHGTDSDGGFGPAAQVQVSQGATVLGTIDLRNQARNTGNTLTSNFGPIALRLPGVTTGTLTVTVNTLLRSGAQGFIDALVRVSPTPPTILAVKTVRVLDPTRIKPSMLAYVRSLYDTMAAEFGANVVVCDPEQWPVPSFTQSGTGFPPLAVSFTDTSTGTIATWAWDFGDGNTSTVRNPTHTYTVAGAYTVSLTTTGPTGTAATATAVVTVRRTQAQLMTVLSGSTNRVVDTDGSNVLTEIP